MEARISFEEISPQLYGGLKRIQSYVNKSGIDLKLIELVKYRVSQINGCAFCLDMHYKEAIHLGESEVRLHSLPAWRECHYYSDLERAVLAYTEALTKLSDHGLNDALYNDLARHLNKEQILALTAAIAHINTWNRLNHAIRPTPGTYVVRQFEK